MKITVVSAFCLGNGVDAFPGETVDVSPDYRANEFISNGQAVPFVEPVIDEPQPNPDPEPDSTPKRRTR